MQKKVAHDFRYVPRTNRRKPKYSEEKKSCSAPFFLPQISHGLACDRTRASLSGKKIYTETSERFCHWHQSYCTKYTVVCDSITSRIITASFHKPCYQADISNALAGVFSELQIKLLTNVYPNKFKTPTLQVTAYLPNADRRSRSRS